MSKPIRKAVFPVAGLGTRFLPATKANPKEMLPIVDKPLIQFAVEEALAAGIQQLIFVTSSSKRAIEDHFDPDSELENRLMIRGHADLVQVVRSIRPAGVHCIYVRQADPEGLGHAVLCAREIIGDEPFAVLLADDLISGGGRGCIAQLLDVYAQRGGNVIGVEKIAPSDCHKYGVINGTNIDKNLMHLTQIVEKPSPADAPSDLGVAGRYILQPEIFSILEYLRPGRSGEVQLTDAIAELIKIQQVYALQFAGVRYDCGSKFGYVTATLQHALRHPEIQQEFREYLQAMLNDPTTFSEALTPLKVNL